MKKIFLVLVLFFCCFFSKAQENVVYVAPGETFNWFLPYNVDQCDSIMFNYQAYDCFQNCVIYQDSILYGTNIVEIMLPINVHYVAVTLINVGEDFVGDCSSVIYVYRRE